jgi:hypothetical protein
MVKGNRKMTMEKKNGIIVYILTLISMGIFLGGKYGNISVARERVFVS